MGKKKAGILLSDANLKRRYPTSGLASDICLPSDDAIWLPSRCLAINYLLGGGIKYGKILEEYGEESTGKSLLATEFATVCQQLGGIVLWQDAESSFDAFWTTSHGMKLDQTVLLPEENIIEIISDWQADQIVYWRSRLTNNEPILLVVDSLAALETFDNMEAADSDSGEDMGRRSKKIYQMLRKRRKFYAKYGVCVIYINQLRKKVNATKWEDPDTTPGGTAMKFYADLRMGLYRSKRIVDQETDEVIGNLVNVKMKKNKTAPPRGTVKAAVYFVEHEGNYGYDRYYGFDDLVIKLGLVENRQGKFYYKDELIAKGAAKPDEGKESGLLRIIRTDKKLRQELIEAAGINTINKTRKKIEKLGTNLYPVKLKEKNEDS